MIETPQLERRLGGPVATVNRAPFSYRTSHRIDELKVVLADGTRLDLLLKDLRRSELHPRVRAVKPAFLHDPGREVEAYRLLEGSGLGTPRCIDSGDEWLLLEKVEGVELWQAGEIERWLEAARWLALFHAQSAKRPPVGTHLLQYDASYFALWKERVRPQPELERVLDRY